MRLYKLSVLLQCCNCCCRRNILPRHLQHDLSSTWVSRWSTFIHLKLLWLCCDLPGKLQNQFLCLLSAAPWASSVYCNRYGEHLIIKTQLLFFYCGCSQHSGSLSRHPSHQEVELCSQCAGRRWSFPFPPPFKLGAACNLLQTER